MHREVPFRKIKPVADFKINTREAILRGYTGMLNVVGQVFFVSYYEGQLGIDKTLEIIDVPKVCLFEFTQIVAEDIIYIFLVGKEMLSRSRPYTLYGGVIKRKFGSAAVEVFVWRGP
jgi:hypothetical protein